MAPMLKNYVKLAHSFFNLPPFSSPSSSQPPIPPLLRRQPPHSQSLPLPSPQSPTFSLSRPPTPAQTPTTTVTPLSQPPPPRHHLRRHPVITAGGSLPLFPSCTFPSHSPLSPSPSLLPSVSHSSGRTTAPAVFTATVHGGATATCTAPLPISLPYSVPLLPDKENQQLPSTNPDIFPNLYCELQFSRYRTTKLNTEKKLLLPTDVRRSITGRILELGIDFVDRDLGDINVRGREIMITETAIEEALQCRHVPDELCAHQQAELAIHSMTFDYEALRSVIGLPDATWVMDANNTKAKGMLFTHLTREAKTWQMIFACYRPPVRRRSRARAAIGTPSPSAPTAAPSSSTAAAPSSSTGPPAVPEPTYLLVQRLFRFLERERRHDHQEEDVEAPVQQDAHATTAPPQTHEDSFPQPEPEPIVIF
nr:proline-rich protein 12-like [Arachis hypogaea]